MVRALRSQTRTEGVDRDIGIVDLLRASADHLPAPENAEAFGAFFDRFADADVVLLGEATHGTAEFYRARAAITRRLVATHGFRIVAVEADWPDADRVDRYVRHRAPGATRAEAFQRFPSWMWANHEFRDFADWLRGWNEQRPAHDRAEFRGLDVYSLSASIEAVLSYLDHVDPARAALARQRYGCLTPWQDDPARYGAAVMGGADDCEAESLAQLRELLAARLEDLRRDGEANFDAIQNARIVRAAEQYYRLMYRGATESWNLRDRHMFETLQAVRRNRSGANRAVVWAHNSHIGNASATAMGWEGEFNIGELCRNAYGDRAALIGFGTDRGTVAAANAWAAPMEVMTVRHARPDSYERLFARTGLPRSLTTWAESRAGDLRDALSAPRLERAIGVVYRPDSELLSHYFRAVLPDQFDAYVWFDETGAVRPLPRHRPAAVAETYPFGL